MLSLLLWKKGINPRRGRLLPKHPGQSRRSGNGPGLLADAANLVFVDRNAWASIWIDGTKAVPDGYETASYPLASTRRSILRPCRLMNGSPASSGCGGLMPFPCLKLGLTVLAVIGFVAQGFQPAIGIICADMQLCNQLPGIYLTVHRRTWRSPTLGRIRFGLLWCILARMWPRSGLFLHVSHIRC